MRNVIVTTLKIGFSVILMGALGYQAYKNDSFADLMRHEKNWSLFALAWLCVVTTLLIQIFRWRMLTRALGLELPAGEAVRLGFLGNMFSLIGVGMLGGDALKIYFLGRRNHGKVTEAVTAVFADRIVGLFGLILLAGAVSLVFDSSRLGETSAEHKAVRTLCLAAPWAALAVSIGFGVMMLPGVVTWGGWDSLARVPKVGGILLKLVSAMRMYRAAGSSLLMAVCMSLAIHFVNSIVIFLLSHGLPAYAGEIAVPKPSFAGHVAAACLALATGALPVGMLEVVFDTIYRGISEPNMPKEQGFIIVLAYRVLQLCTASIGLYFYLTGRREVAQAIEGPEDDDLDPAAANAAA